MLLCCSNLHPRRGGWHTEKGDVKVNRARGRWWELAVPVRSRTLGYKGKRERFAVGDGGLGIRGGLATEIEVES